MVQDHISKVVFLLYHTKVRENFRSYPVSVKKHGFGWTPGVGDGQGGLMCCGSRDRKESDMTERLN